ncbi:MAG: hypothetical protein IKU96_01180 [Alistipes sp.]|nr:hypothetical protein [Alistipes sp.]
MIRHLYIALLSVVAMAVMCLSATEVRGEVPTISGHFSRDSIEVGDRVEYIIDIETDRATRISLPDFRKARTPKEVNDLANKKRSMSTYEEYNEDIFEFLDEAQLDTVETDGRRLHLRKRYTLAAMETGALPMLPAILYFDKNRDKPDTLYSRDTLRLNVLSYTELDTTLFLKADPTSQQGFGVDSQKAEALLKDEGVYTVKNLPFKFAEVRDYVIYAIIGLVVVALVIWLAYMLGIKRIDMITVVPPKPKLPPHIVAIKALEELKNRKLWQNNKHKLYYSSITSILKVYIEDRWALSVLDKTSNEVIAELRDVDMPRDSRSDLIAILQSADLVKFAKVIPDAEECEATFTRAYYFVENTKQKESHNKEKREITIDTKINE